ncbi:PREDICTED: uncharacterized protein LOC109359932 [Lupinus angustifolius]|uniref:uncharacterized protein LOC109359932 n=1 Tax=Lupinus angustifolius TaxID=3871 RepID=UPI00092EC3F4|nr:PREDICTED: uncharacterized protein LOC109359932 [Lupinus angustifolius]
MNHRCSLFHTCSHHFQIQNPFQNLPYRPKERHKNLTLHNHFRTCSHFHNHSYHYSKKTFSVFKGRKTKKKMIIMIITI